MLRSVYKSMPIISFFGPDGSGKSTLARKLLEILMTRRINARVCWMRGTHTLASVIARFLLVKHESFQGSSNPYLTMRVPLGMRRIWQLLEFASALPTVLFRFVLPSFLGLYVIAERYVLDFIVWVSIITDDNNYARNLEARFFIALASKAYTNIYVTAALGELLRRSKMDRKLLSAQLNLYDGIASALGTYTVDTTLKSVDESLGELLNFLDT